LSSPWHLSLFQSETTLLFDEVLSPKAIALWSMCGKNE
jgi:hypothetical protein